MGKNTIHGDENGMCVLEDDKFCNDCGECDRCDIDPTKICDNCGKCLDEYKTNSKGFIEVPIDKIDMGSSEITLEDFYKELGLDNEDDDE
ncbi:MAG: hypothetical protein IJX17_06480 [Clostridia bacterium]|nr:hypothetical protein [Clostridia bacterium]